VDVDSKDNYDDWTPLLLAANNGHEAVVKLLQTCLATRPTGSDETATHPPPWR